MNIHGSEKETQDCRYTPEGRITAKKYGDIIHLSRPISSRPKMDSVQRAKIFAPFDALRGFDAKIDIAQDKTREVKRMELSEEVKAALADKLRKIRKGMRITVQYFVPDQNENTGNYMEITGAVTRIDPFGKTLALRNRMADTTGGKIEKVPPVTVRFDDISHISQL